MVGLENTDVYLFDIFQGSSDHPRVPEDRNIPASELKGSDLSLEQEGKVGQGQLLLTLLVSLQPYKY